MKRTLSWALAIVLTVSLQAQSVKDKRTLPSGRQDLERLCGCYEVEFKYAETFFPDTSYKFHDRNEVNGGRD